MTFIDSGATGSPTFPDNPDTHLYTHLLCTAAKTGRCPVWLGPDALEAAGALERPDDVIREIDATDADVVLARWWPGPCRPECPCDEALPELPDDPANGSAPDMSRSVETFASAVELLGAPGPMARLAVVDATRPADVPAVVGWTGIANYFPFQDLVCLSSVLRRWEDTPWAAMRRRSAAPGHGTSGGTEEVTSGAVRPGSRVGPHRHCRGRAGGPLVCLTSAGH